jgi:hypothetical protein
MSDPKDFDYDRALARTKRQGQSRPVNVLTADIHEINKLSGLIPAEDDLSSFSEARQSPQGRQLQEAVVKDSKKVMDEAHEALHALKLKTRPGDPAHDALCFALNGIRRGLSRLPR